LKKKKKKKRKRTKPDKLSLLLLSYLTIEYYNEHKNIFRKQAEEYRKYERNKNKIKVNIKPQNNSYISLTL